MDPEPPAKQTPSSFAGRGPKDAMADVQVQLAECADFGSLGEVLHHVGPVRDATPKSPQQKLDQWYVLCLFLRDACR